MSPVTILLGLVVVYLLLQNAHAAIVQPPPFQVTGLPGNAVGQAQQTSMMVGSGIGMGTQEASSLASNAGLAVAGAVPIIGSAIGAVAGVLLARHTARLQGATAENQAIPAAVTAWDKDIAEIIGALNSGQITQAQAVAYLQATDLQTYNYMHSLVGKPGTAWNGSCTPAKCTCDKTCTAACCVYYNDLKCALIGGGSGVPAGGLVAVVQRGSGTITIPKVYPPGDSRYGTFTRPGYTVEVAVPAASATIGSLFGGL